MCGKIDFFIRTKFGVVLDMDPMIMIVVTKRQKDKNKKGKKTKMQKRQKGKKKSKRQKGKNGKNAKRQKKKNNAKSKNTKQNIVVKCVVKYVQLKNCCIRTKFGVVLDMDPMIMIVVTKTQKHKKAIREKDKNTKI